MTPTDYRHRLVMLPITDFSLRFRCDFCKHVFEVAWGQGWTGFGLGDICVKVADELGECPARPHPQIKDLGEMTDEEFAGTH